MKKTLLAAVALTGLAALSNAGAAGSGDLLIGFQAAGGTGASQNLVVDLGNVNINTIGGTLSSLNLDLGSDLSNTYGPNWFSRTDLYWGIVGANYPTANGDSANTLYASTLTGNSSWNRATAASQGTIRANVFNTYSQINVDGNNAQNGVAVGSVLMATTEGGSWSAYNTYGGTSFGGFNNSIEASVASGLDLYRLAPSSTAGLPGTLQGTLAISSGGVVSAVPEPSTYALFGFGALILVIAYRRKANA